MATVELSERQRAAVAAAVTILAAAVITVAIGGLFWVVGLFFTRFSNVFLPLAVAAVAALVFKPYFDWLHERARLPKGVALAAVYLSVLIPLAAFLWFFGSLVVDQASELVDRAPHLWSRLVDEVRERAPRVAEVIREHPVLQQLKGAVAGGGQGGGLVGGLQALGSQALSAGRGVVRWVGTLACWVMLPIYFSFFLISDPRQVLDLERHLPFLKQQTRSDVGYLVREFVNILVAFFRGQLVIAFLQGLLFAIGFTLVGLSYGFVIGLTLGFLNIIPYLGNIVGLAVALPLAFFQPGGGWLTLLLTIAVFVAVQTIEGYLLTPKIMGDRTGLHPMIIIVAVFFWGTALSGITGMVLAIPLTAFLVVFWRLARERYIKELV